MTKDQMFQTDRMAWNLTQRVHCPDNPSGSP